MINKKQKTKEVFYNEELDKYVKNLNDMNYGFKICSFLSPLIMKHFIKFNNPKEFLGSTFKMKDILDVLEKE